MALITSIKNLVENLPEGIGRPLASVPYSMRFGFPYIAAGLKIRKAERVDPVLLEHHLLSQLRGLLHYAVKHITFYRDFYKEKGFLPDEVQSLSDWKYVPIVTKDDLQRVPLKTRTARGTSGIKINTGGTSGQPLEFYIDKRAFSREWAHMHYLWKARGYSPRHIKLTFRGKHFNSTQVLRYNAVHNEYIVNANAAMKDVIQSVYALPHSTVIRWVHGYPSLVSEFAHELSGMLTEKSEVFRSRLFGVLLGSEYPAPIYRTVIEEELSANVVSWYGHSEMSMLARETAKGVYESLPTYGYAEAVPTETADYCHLVCTSLHNRVHPFIRYDTGDVVQPITKQAGALTFRIQEGRIGEFIRDLRGRRHSLTAVIFGRHHAAFEVIRHVQIRENAPGRATLVVTPRDPNVDAVTLLQGFDLSDLDIEWGIEIVETPVRTDAGKIRLKLV